MVSNNILAWTGCGVALAILYLFQQLRFRTRNLLPPGPSSFPLIGNIQCLISRPTWITFTEWYQKYDSDIIHVNVAGNPIIILNTLEAATELFERRSATYSSRPPLTMLNDLIGWKWAFVGMPYGPEWKACRKLFTTMFNPNNADQHEPQELKAARNFLLNLHEKPEQYAKLVRKMTGSSILSVAYGFDVNVVQDSVHTYNAERAADGFIAASIPGSFLVDYLPWLKYIPSWVPGASFQRQARIWKADMEKLLHGPFAAAKSSLIEGGMEPCFVTRCFEQLSDPDSNAEGMIEQTAGVMYLAGTDTAVVALTTFFLAMVKYPGYQKKAQQELDRVVGSNRLPEFDDKSSLPYIQAILNEVLRYESESALTCQSQPGVQKYCLGGSPSIPWVRIHICLFFFCVEVPLTVMAHLSTEEDIYRGYRIPKNATVMANVWAMFHDETKFPDPYTFNPDRYICAADGQLNLGVMEPTSGFGFGRRACPGRHMALSTIWITIASVLAVYDISNALDENGEIIIPTGDYDTTTVQNRPYPFECSFKLRSPERLDVMRTSVEFVEGK
ncbi:cytochrome P450 [Gymnopus androsaceus JB14]|uniref:Cytochrome P450 n=1 Tax=Gymnopus androsaceus JB14 TaxID=1447944 RepID=A0A6A4GXE7_9AGAR|nr:cytochrome P450 [Gymnopus androsaceus JB14]